MAIDEAVDDVLPLAIAHKFRERLREQQTVEASTSNEDGEKRKARGKKVDHLYRECTMDIEFVGSNALDILECFGFLGTKYFGYS